MSYHARPLSPHAGTTGRDLTESTPAPMSDPGAERIASRSSAERAASVVTGSWRIERAHRALAAEDARPWYRRESWLVVELTALVPAFVAFTVPQTARAPLTGVSAAFLLAGLGMLLIRSLGSRAHIVATTPSMERERIASPPAA